MNHDIHLHRSRHLKLRRLCMWELVQWLLNMHGRHSAAAIGPHIIFSKIPGLLLGNHARTSAKSLPWPTERTFAVAVGHYNGILQV